MKLTYKETKGLTIEERAFVISGCFSPEEIEEGKKDVLRYKGTLISALTDNRYLRGMHKHFAEMFDPEDMY